MTATYHQQRYAAALDHYVTPGCRWVDVGAGSRLHGGWGGVSQQDLAARAFQLTGCDPDLAHLRTNPWITDVEADLSACASDHYDLATGNMVLEHVQHPHGLFRQLHRVLKPGGRFVAMTPYAGHPIIALSRLVPAAWRTRYAVAKEGRVPEHIYRTWYRANRRGTLWRLAARTGFLIDTLHTFQSSQPLLPGVLGTVESWAGFDSNILLVLRKPGLPQRQLRIA